MTGRKIIQDSDDESNCGNSPPPIDHESDDPSLDTDDLHSAQPSTSSTGEYPVCRVRNAMADLRVERLDKDLRDAHHNLLEPTPKSISSATTEPSSHMTKSQIGRATLEVSRLKEKEIKEHGRTSRDEGDFHGHSEDELGGGTSLSHSMSNEEVQDSHTPLEVSAAASRVNSMLKDYRGPEISVLSSGGVGKHFGLETSVHQIATPSMPTVVRNIPSRQSESTTWPTMPNMTPAQSSSATTHSSKQGIANTREHEVGPVANSSSGSNKTTSLSRDSTDSAAAHELGSDDPAIGLPKDQYQPRPSRSRGGDKANDLLIPESFSKRPEALLKEKRKAKNRRKTTALEKPTPKIEVEDEDEEEVKVPLVAIPKLPPRPRGLYPYNDETDCEKSPDKSSRQAIATDQDSEDAEGDHRGKQEAKERKEVVPASPSPKKRGRGRPKKQSIQPAGDIQNFEVGEEAVYEPNEGSTKLELAQGDKKRKSRADHASPGDEHGEDSADDQETHQDNSNGNDDTMTAPSDYELDIDLPPIYAPNSIQRKPQGHSKRKLDDVNDTVSNASDHDDTATDTAQSVKAPPKKRGRKKKAGLPATSAAPIIPLDEEASKHPEKHVENEPGQDDQAPKALSPTKGNTTREASTISPKKIATPPTTQPKVVKPVHSPITSSTVKFRVGLSKNARIAPLLKIVRK